MSRDEQTYWPVIDIGRLKQPMISSDNIMSIKRAQEFVLCIWKMLKNIISLMFHINNIQEEKNMTLIFRIGRFIIVCCISEETHQRIYFSKYEQGISAYIFVNF